MSEMNRISEQVNRDYSMDILRILAILIVILFHVSYPFFDNVYNNTQWIKALFPDTMSRWGVPVFIMISGAFMLQKNISINELWTKYIKRLAILLVLWNIIYYIPNYQSFNFGVKDILSIFFSSSDGYHLWFLYMLISIYIIIPILKMIVEGDLTKYVLILWFCTSILFFWFVQSGTFKYLQTYLLNFPFLCDYVVFFLLGHYLYKQIILTRRQRIIIYILGFLALICMSFGTYCVSLLYGKTKYFFLEYLSISNVMVSIALFVFFRYFDFNSSTVFLKLRKIIGILSNLTLGVYLVHIMVLSILYHYFPVDYYLKWDAAIAIPLIWIVATLISFTISFIMSKIPFVRILVK